MAILVLLRHGRSTANTAGLLAGRGADVHLDEVGESQAERVAARFAGVPIARIVSSPLERCQQTAAPLVAASGTALETDDGLIECDYGAWTGQAIKDLVSEPTWATVQQQPSAAHFPDGESMLDLAARAARTARRLDAEVRASHGDQAVCVAVSHGDVIKAILADALGMHLDLFQRLHVDPASISVIRYTPQRPFVLATNTADGELSWLKPKSDPHGEAARQSTGDAALGGGAGAI